MFLSKTKKRISSLERENIALRKLIAEKEEEIDNEKSSKQLLEQYHNEDIDKAFHFSKQVVLNAISYFDKQSDIKNKIISLFYQLVNDEVINRNIRNYGLITFNPILTDNEKKRKLKVVKNLSTEASDLEYFACRKELHDVGVFPKHPEYRKICGSNVNVVQMLELDSFGIVTNDRIGPTLTLNTESIEYKEYLFKKSINGIAYYLIKNESFYNEFLNYLNSDNSEKIENIA